MASVFVNPEWITVPGSTSTEVYVSGDLVYNDSGHGGTEATCYSTFEKAYGVALSGDTIYVYDDSASPLSISAPSGTYHQQLISESFYIRKNLYVRAGTFQLERGGVSWLSFNIDGSYLLDFGVTDSFIVGAQTTFNVMKGANFQLGSNVGSNPVSFENSGTLCVTDGSGSGTGPSSTFHAGTTSITNSGVIEVTASTFSVASVTNTGTFKVEYTSKLEIGNLSGTITLNNENVTLNASSITGGNISATAYGAIFTGANTLNGVALNATGKTVTVGTGNSDSLTVKGTSSLKIGTLSGTIKTDADALTTLNASSISGGSIYAQNNLKFTGVNTLNDVTLNASGKTVTVGTDEDDSLTVGGTSTLTIGTLDGTILTDSAAATTLNVSSITGGAITAQAALTFTGANTLNGVTLNVAGNNVTVNDTLTLDGTSSLNASNITGSGSISVLGCLTFTGENTLANITISAVSRDVTVGDSDPETVDSLTLTNSTLTASEVTTSNGGTLTVSGTNTLNIEELNGEIKTAGGVTLTGSNITGGSITALGSVTVNNSTISSNTFTATTVNGVGFYGQNTLDGVTLETGTSTYEGSVYIDTDGTLTIKGKSTLKTPGLLGTRTINLDGAEIVDSRILGNNGAGGTLVVGTDKTATFSTTESNSNDFGRTSIDNSGSITVNGTLSLSTITGTISNSGTINVNGNLSTGAITNTNGTIALNGGATVSSAISGGSITTSNTGTVTVQYSTISSSAFTTTADEVIFYYRNTLNGVTLDATGKAVTVNGTLTVKGTSTLNATNITGGTISAQDNLTFTGTNTLKNGVTLDATGETTVTIGNGDEIADSLTVEGTSKLNIASLNGTILTDSEAATTLNDSSITGGSISAQNNLAFTGANTLNGITLDATAENTTVKANSTLTVEGTNTLNIRSLDGTIKTGSAGTTLTGSDINGGGTNGGTITALGNLTFAGTNTLNGVALNASGKTVTVDTFWVQGTSTLTIGTLNGVIRTKFATTFSNSTISGGDGGLFIYEKTAVTFAGANTVNAQYWNIEGGARYRSITNRGSISVESIPASGSNPAIAGVLSAYSITNVVSNDGIGSITVGASNDACSLDVTYLTNNSELSVIGKDQNNLSNLDATEIVNNGMMALTYSELNATTLTNNASGISQSTAGMTISNSTVSASGENPLVITNGNSNTFATIEFNNSTVTAGQVTNFSFHNGQDPTWGTWGLVVTNQSFFSVNDLSNTGWIQVTDSTLSATSVYIGKIDNVRNYSGKLQVNGTSTLDIASLEGTITIGSSYFLDPITLKDSHITGKVDNGNRLGNISVTNPLTFTGANTLTNISLVAENAGRPVTIGNDASLTVKGTSTLNIASLDGMIDLAAIQEEASDPKINPILKDSSITGKVDEYGNLFGSLYANTALTFTGTNTLNSVVLNAADQTVTVDSGATLTINAASTITAGSIIGSGSITINAAGFSGTKKIIDLGSGSEEISNISLGTHPDDVTLYYDGEDYWLRTASAYVNTAWSPSVHPDDDSTNIHYGQNAFSTVQAALAANLDELVIDNGTFEASGDNVPTFNGVTTTISGGSFSTSVCGGKRYTGDATGEILSIGSSEELKDIQLTITGGNFAKSVFVGDRMDRNDYLTRYGDLSLTIEGGSFSNAVAGGGTFASSDAEGGYTLHGDVYLTIQGGTFINDGNKSWIYGGCLAANKVLAAQTNIYGTVTVTIDASDNDVSFSNLVVGSFGTGKIIGSTKLVLTGSNNVTAGGDIWGGCGKDYYTIGGNSKTFVKKSDDPEAEDGDRMLSFTGFNGTLDCSRIRDFTSAEFIGVSIVELNKACDMRYISNWEFENGSTLSGSSFLNDFTGDTFVFSGSEEGFSSADVLKNVGASALTGFAYEVEDEKLVSGFSSVKLFGYDATWNGSNAYVTDTGSSTNYKLYLNNAETPSAMLVGIA